MSQGLCPSCGAAVNLTAGTTETKCKYCDTIVTQQQAEAQFNEIKNSKFGGTLLIAETAQEGGSYSEALNYWNKVIEQEPTFADAWLNKGICIVRTSTIGNLKISEATSSWKAAIKFAKNIDAMKKRVALEITHVILDFWPVLEDFYLQHNSKLKDKEEHFRRFESLESSLALAFDLFPNEVIAEAGILLCDRFEKSAKSTDASWVLSSELRALLQKKTKYEQLLKKNDPVFAKKLEQEKATAEKQGNWGCLIIAVGLLCLFGWATIVRAMKAGGLMETTQDRSEHIGPAVFFGICALVLVFAVAYAVRQLFKKNDQGK